MTEDATLNLAAIVSGHRTVEARPRRTIRLVEPSAMTSVACVFCGCDLYPDPTAASQDVWFHFAPVGVRDANGCRLRCATSGHGPDGWPRPHGGQR